MSRKDAKPETVVERATPEEMARYYNDDYAVWGSQEGESTAAWQDFYSRCCQQHHEAGSLERRLHEVADKGRKRNRRKRARRRRKP